MMKIFSPVRNALKSQRGYSLIELIGAMMIFVLITVVIISALLSVIRSSSKTGAERRTQQEARYGVEEMARQTRSSSIDYAFYAQNASDARCAIAASAAGNTTRTLALVFTESDEANAPVTKRMIFFQEGGAVFRYENSVGSATPSCDQVFTAPTTPSGTSGEHKTRLTTEKPDISVPALTFYVSPGQDPYAQTACPVPADNCLIARNTHPRVTIVLTVQVTGSGTGVNQQSGKGTTIIQTTINSRVYQANKLLGQPT